MQLAVSVADVFVASSVAGERRFPIEHPSQLAWLGVLNPGVAYALSLAGLARITASAAGCCSGNVASRRFIDYRRLSMKVARDDAETWATWFKALGDPTRIVILNLLATAAGPMSVAEIVEAVDVGQSTVSHHLKILGDVRFLLVDRDGTSSRWRINHTCLGCFPTAAELVMGRAPTAAQWKTMTCTRTTTPKQPTRKATR